MSTDAYPAHPEYLVQQLRASREFFERSTSVLEDEHGDFTPQEGMMTVTQQVAHVADTFDWFHDALVDMKGFDMDFEAMAARVAAVPSLSAARESFGRSHDRLIAFVEKSTPEALAVKLPENDPIMAGEPRAALIAAVVEHAAHHRGSLAVYARLAGLEPSMPYGEMPG